MNNILQSDNFNIFNNCTGILLDFHFIIQFDRLEVLDNLESEIAERKQHPTTFTTADSKRTKVSSLRSSISLIF